MADANARRPEALFGDLFHGLYQRYYGRSPDSRWKKDLLSRLHILDSTTIILFSDVMHGTGAYGMDGRKKGGAKAHVVMRAQDQVPCIIDLAEGRRNDKAAMSSVPLAKGSVLVFDMGYTSFGQWQAWCDQGIHWVTRLQDGVRVRVTEHLPVDDAQRDAGVIGDQLVLLGAGSDPGTGAHHTLPSQAHWPHLPFRDQQHALGARHHRAHLQMPVGHRAAIQARQAELPAALLPGRQSQRHQVPDLVRLHR